MFKKSLLPSVLATIFALTFLPAITAAQDAEDKAIATRQGFMKLVVWEAGPLFGMAKGDMAYDAKAAAQHAANLKIISQYPVGGLFLPATSNEDRKGKTRALAKIWGDMDGFVKAMNDWKAAVANVEAEAGKGHGALAAAVGALGKSCGGCHKPYRAEDF